MQTSPYAITISRQLGSGGAYLGQRVAERLGILYIDRQILCKAAEKLNLPEDVIECREERGTSFWQSMAQSSVFANPDAYIPPQAYFPSSRELHQVESKYIEEIAIKNSSVIVGRGGSYILKNHPRHLSVFLHANMQFRKKRIQEVYKVSENEAIKMIETSDKERAKYIHAMTRQDWSDSKQYDISLNTGSLGLGKVEEIILTCIKARFVENED